MKTIKISTLLLSIFLSGCFSDGTPSESKVEDDIKDYINTKTYGVLSATDIVVHKKSTPTDSKTHFDVSYYIEKNEKKYQEYRRQGRSLPLERSNYLLKKANNGLRKVELKYVKKDNRWHIATNYYFMWANEFD